MGGHAATVLAVILLFGVVIILMVIIQRVLLKRAARRVVAMFRAQGATSPKTAASLEELGLGRSTPLSRTFRPRDYRPYAARLLGQAGVIKATEDGRVYLSEEDLAHSFVKKFARIE